MPKKPRLIFNIVQFLAIVVAVFILTFIALYAVGAVPNSFKFFVETPIVSTSTPQASSGSNAGPVVDGFLSNPNLPQWIRIPSIGVNSVILNPVTTDVASLDQDLLRGAIRYPTSGVLGQGTVFLFGHNTGLPAINPAYKTFNGLRTIKTGATIEVDSATRRYFYTVQSLSLVNSTTAYVTISAHNNELIISTCNVFGAKEQRYVVHATFTNSQPITGQGA